MAKQKPQTIAQTARKKRYADLLKKLRDGKPLNKSETKEIELYEDANTASPTNWQEMNQVDVSACIGVTRVQLNQWLRQGMPVKVKGGKKFYSVKDIFKWRIKQEKELLQSGLDADLAGENSDALEAYRKVKTESEQHKLDILKGKYIEREKHIATLQNAADYVKQYFSNIGKKLGVKTSKSKDPAETSRMIQSEIDKTLMKMVDEFTPSD